MYSQLLLSHKISVIVFVAIYVIKNILLLSNKKDALTKFTKIFKVPEMIISVLFLATGVYLWINTANGGIWIPVKLVIVLASIPLAIIGFKKSNKVLAVLSLLLLLVAYRFGETRSLSMKKSKTPAASAVSAEENSGAAIYASQCISCHGEDGRMGLSGAKDLSASVISREEAVTLITNGKGAMASYEGVLTPEQIGQVADYIQSLKK
jgi:mono/diheme cytochrome c family protein